MFRAAAYPLLLLTVFGLVLVLAVGHEVLGATRELTVAGLAMQPSEFAKLAFVLWGADLLARKEKLGQLTEWRQLLVPLMPGMAILALLVLLGNDLGTTLILLMIFLALLWVMGSPGKLFVGMLGADGVHGDHPDHRAAVPAGPVHSASWTRRPTRSPPACRS